MIGIFSSSNMVLPILMGIPIATSLVVKKQMSPRVFLALVRVPLVSFAILFLFGWFFPAQTNWLYNNEPLNIAGNLGFLLIVLSPLSKAVRRDFRSDFNKSWGHYYTSKNNLNLNSTAFEAGSLKEIQAAIKVSTNVYFHTTSAHDSALHFKHSDSRFRYMIFCMTLTLKSCEDLMTSFDALSKGCLDFIIKYTTSNESVQEFFSGQMNFEHVEKTGAIYLKEYTESLVNYYNIIANGDKKKATELISSMISSTGIDTIMSEQLSLEIEQFIPAIRGAFIDSTKIE
jgi:hypothetical protein